MRLLAIAMFVWAVALPAQQTARPDTQGSSSSSSSNPDETAPSSTVVHRGVQQTGSPISLDTSESLFQMAAALNSCGYDAGLDNSLPVRAAVRSDVAAAIAASPAAQASQTALCKYVADHALTGAQDLAQYVSLALFAGPPPELALSVPETEMPPDSLQVVEVLPLLREFAAQTQLHAIFVRHRAAYEAATEQVRGSITRMLLETNIYLHQPVSSYDGRRFTILLEPMLSPQAVNARIYGNDYFVTVSPAMLDAAAQSASVNAGSRVSVGARAAGLHMDEIRHVYLLYSIDPILYARASSTARLQPMLKAIADAPIGFLYKNDIVAFTTECLIKAIEARTMDVGFAPPAKTAGSKQRTESDGYNASLADYERRADAVRRRQVALDVLSGWTLTQTLYDKLSLNDREGVGLKESFGEMVYGTDISFEVNRAKHTTFFAADSPDLVGGTVGRARAPKRTLTAMDQAEMRLQKGDRSGAEELADKELVAHPNSGEALYVLARVKLMEGDPQAAYDRFTQVLDVSKDAHAVAWSHVYLGRLYDTQQQSNRAKAIAEYRAALAVPGVQADARIAADNGIKQPFAAPKRTAADSDAAKDDEELDPTGKKQKESYKPTEEARPR